MLILMAGKESHLRRKVAVSRARLSNARSSTPETHHPCYSVIHLLWPQNGGCFDPADLSETPLIVDAWRCSSAGC